MKARRQVLKPILMITLSAVLFYGMSDMTMPAVFATFNQPDNSDELNAPAEENPNPQADVFAQTGDVEINEENFPDAGFREYLRTAPEMQKFHQDPDKFTAQEIELITVLNMKDSSLNAESLAGIENFKNLTTLHCNGSSLKTIDLSRNTALKYLECTETWNLTNLNVKNCTNLHTLYCGDCKLTDLDLSDNGQLETLWCNSNQLSTLNVANNPQLKIFHCYDNQLTTLDISQNTLLKELWCQTNQLTALDVIINSSLTSLSCENNRLTEIKLNNHPYLTTLSVQNNQLTSLDVSGCGALYYLHCSNNQLSKLDTTENIALHDLKCTDNQLAELDVKDNPSLYYFHAGHNQLKTLDVSKNGNLSYFYCNNNQLKEIDVSKNYYLATFWCQNNQLEILDVSGNEKMSNLNCTGNRLKSLSLPICTTSFADCEQYDTIILAENENTCDLGTADPKLNPSMISELTGAQIAADSKTLTDIRPGRDVTYTYNCENAKTMKVTLHFIWTNRWTTELTTIPGWKYGDTPSVPHAEALYGEAQYLYGTAPKGDDYSAEIPSEPGTWYVKAIVPETENYSGLESAPVEFVIDKNDSAIALKDSAALTKTYDGQPVTISKEDVIVTGSQGELLCKWYQKEADDWKPLTDAPVNAGKYKAEISVAEDNHYYPPSPAEKEFEIVKASPPEIILPENLSALQGVPLSSVILPQGWTWITPDETVISNKETYQAILEVDDRNYDYTEVEGYDAARHGVIRELSVTAAIEETTTRLDIGEGIREIPDTLIAAGMDTEEKITTELSRVVAENQGYFEENVVVYDVKLQISFDGGITWNIATPENFPAEGLLVALPYPEGTNGTDYNFIVTHMFTHEMNGYKPGQVETLNVKKTTEGLQFTIHSLSPIAVAWKSVNADDDENQGDKDKPTEKPGITDPSNPDSDDLPTPPETGKPSEDSINPEPDSGSKTNTETMASKNRSPKTGDNSCLWFWIFMTALSGAGFRLSKKRQNIL